MSKKTWSILEWLPIWSKAQVDGLQEVKHRFTYGNVREIQSELAHLRAANEALRLERDDDPEEGYGVTRKTTAELKWMTKFDAMKQKRDKWKARAEKATTDLDAAIAAVQNEVKT